MRSWEFMPGNSEPVLLLGSVDLFQPLQCADQMNKWLNKWRQMSRIQQLKPCCVILNMSSQLLEVTHLPTCLYVQRSICLVRNRSMELLERNAFAIWGKSSLRFITLGKFTQFTFKTPKLQGQNCFYSHVYICRQQGRTRLNKYQHFDKVTCFMQHTQ